MRTIWLFFTIISTGNCFSQNLIPYAIPYSSGEIYGVTNDQQGFSYVIGKFAGEELKAPIQEPIQGLLYNTNNLHEGYFLFKQNTDGSLLWHKQYWTNGYMNGASSISSFADTIVYSCMNFASNDTIYFDSLKIKHHWEVMGNNLPSTLILSKLNEQGTLLWHKLIPIGKGWVTNLKTKATNDGGVVLAGVFHDTLYFDSLKIFSSDHSHDFQFFVASYSSTGILNWVRNFGGDTDEDYINDLTIDVHNNIYLAGRFYSRFFEMDTIMLRNHLDPWDFQPNAFLAKLNPEGKVLWAIANDTINEEFEEFNNVAIDQDMNLIVTGRFNSPSLNLPDTTIMNPNELGENSIFFASFQANNGSIKWLKTSSHDFYLPPYFNFTNLMIDYEANNVYAAGKFYGDKLQIGGVQIQNKHTVLANKSENFILQASLTGDVKSYLSFGTNQDDYPNALLNASPNYLTFSGRFYLEDIDLPDASLTSPGGEMNAYVTTIAKENFITSINRFETNNSPIIHPNPSSDGIFSINQLPENCTHISVSSLIGTISFFEPASNIIVLSDLPKGIYFVRFYHDLVLLHTEKIMRF
jgi:hypothetical protein